MIISYEKALKLAMRSSKFAHSITVSAIMRSVARKLCEKEQEWALVGLLHDLDYDDVRENMARHGALAAEMLQDKLPRHCIHAIKAHDHRARSKPKSKLDNVLIAADSAAFLIENAKEKTAKTSEEALLEHVESLSTTQPWLRDSIFKCEQAGLGIDEFLRLCLDSAKEDLTKGATNLDSKTRTKAHPDADE